MLKYVFLNLISIAVIAISAAIFYAGFFLDDLLLSILSGFFAAIILGFSFFILKNKFLKNGLFSKNNFRIIYNICLLFCLCPLEIYLGYKAVYTVLDIKTSWMFVFFYLIALLILFSILLTVLLFYRKKKFSEKNVFNIVSLFRKDKKEYFFWGCLIILLLVVGFCIHLSIPLFLFGAGFVPFFSLLGILLYISATAIAFLCIPCLLNKLKFKSNFRSRYLPIMITEIWLSLNLLSWAIFLISKTSLSLLRDEVYSEIIIWLFLVFFIVSSIISYITHALLIYRDKYE